RELEPLAESINAFIESERENLDRQRNTLADLAHSLKTPLAVLRTRLDADAPEDELRRELDTQLRRMTELVSYQLARAASGGHALFSAPVPIEPEAEALVTSLEKVYASKGVLCEFDLAEGTRPLLVEVQALVDSSPLSNPRRVAVGLEGNRLAMLL